LAKRKDILYSFIGAYDPEWYLTDVRKRIFDMKHSESAVVKKRPYWHFAPTVYDEQLEGKDIPLEKKADLDERENEYRDILARSIFSLCPSGSGPNTIRLWESLYAGAIPVILSDDLILPDEECFEWDRCVIRIPEKDVEKVPAILQGMSDQEMQDRKRRCLQCYIGHLISSGSRLGAFIKRNLRA